MVIEALDLQNYRNYELLSMKFSDKTNILYGDNAQGKTNILEAIYVAGTTKSHRASFVPAAVLVLLSPHTEQTAVSVPSANSVASLL